jgi:hypothetical protein
MATTKTQTATNTLAGYAAASTRRVTAGNGIEYAYRDLGESAVPLVLLQHFRGNLNNWDPAQRRTAWLSLRAQWRVARSSQHWP